MSQGQRRLAAIMLTDMIGYTALGQKNESLSLALVDEQRKLVRPLLRKHEGREVKTIGDAFLVEFPSALEAVRCAYDIQRSIREFNVSLPEERRVHLRIGVHVGDVVESRGDISGDAVNVASRIEPLSEDGGVCITHQVYDHVRNKFEIPMVSLGSKSLKNVNLPITVYKMVMPWESERVEVSVQLDTKRIAILPFANMSSDPNDSYFADGVTEELISTLSNISGLQVISRTSVMGYKGTNKRIPEIGQELKVGSVLEGSVRKAESLVRVAVQLIDVQSDRHVWSQSYDRELRNIFALQSEIAQHVADSLRVKILTPEAEKIGRKPTEKTDAYLLYLKGRQYWNKRSKDGVSKAIEHFTLARALDPKFALAHVGLADSYITQGVYGDLEDTEAQAKARPEILRALQLDDSLAEAHATNGLILRDYDWKWDAALAEFEKSIELNSNYASAHQWYSGTLEITGRLDEALAEAKKAMELDPLSPVIITNVGLRLAAMERYDDAIEYYKKALLVEPNFPMALDPIAEAYAEKGELDEATRWMEKWTSVVPELPALSRLGFAILRALAGERDEAIRLLDSALRLPDSKRIPRVYVGYFYLVLHDRERALDSLSEALMRHERAVMYIKSIPYFKELRSDPRFVKILETMGLDKY